jgi:hypothetical protein
MLRAADTRLTNLLARKRHELRINGRAWFQTELVWDYVGVVLPKSTIEFTYDSKSVDSVLSKTGFAHAASEKQGAASGVTPRGLKRCKARYPNHTRKIARRVARDWPLNSATPARPVNLRSAK